MIATTWWTDRRTIHENFRRRDEMKRLYRSTLIALGAALLIGTGARASLAACGDLNSSGGIEPGDAVILAGHLGGSGACTANPDCDLDGDGTNGGVGDIVFMLNRLAGVETLTAPCVGLGPVLSCPSTLSGDITSNRQLAGPCPNHVIDGTVKVRPNVTLTIQPGATTLARRVSSNGSASVLIVLQDGKVNMPGTSVAPIVMTSDAAPGSRGVGDWGGLVLLGRAPINVPGGIGSAEGLPPGDAPFGGSEPNDSSGLIRFARIEFSGIEFSADNELNVFTQNGVGRGTTVENVQANVGFDDCIEWFGGTVRGKFLVASGCRDDLLDWQLGWTGAVQFALGLQNAGTATGTGRNGIEADNNENGHDFSPRSNPDMCNLTLVGAKPQGATVGGRSGAKLRRGTAGVISNSIIAGWEGSGVELDNDATATQACLNPTTLKTTGTILRIQNTQFYNNGDAATAPVAASPNHANEGNIASPCTQDQLYGLWASGAGVAPADSALGTDPGFGGVMGTPYPTSGTTSAYIPPNAAPWVGAPDCQAVNPDYFDSATYVGAFDPAGANWLSTPWISFSLN
jgi:hypothetical protein